MRDDRDRLIDIVAAIDRILAKTRTGKGVFAIDEMLQVWVLHHLQIVGEAVRGLSEDFKREHPDPVWSKAVGMRNILVHHYFEIDAGRIWNVVEHDLGPMRDRVSSILASLGPEQSPSSEA